MTRKEIIANPEACKYITASKIAEWLSKINRLCIENSLSNDFRELMLGTLKAADDLSLLTKVNANDEVLAKDAKQTVFYRKASLHTAYRIKLTAEVKLPEDKGWTYVPLHAMFALNANNIDSALCILANAIIGTIRYMHAS